MEVPVTKPRGPVIGKNGFITDRTSRAVAILDMVLRPASMTLIKSRRLTRMYASSVHTVPPIYHQAIIK